LGGIPQNHIPFSILKEKKIHTSPNKNFQRGDQIETKIE
jgi:hypothetical protein